MPIGISATPDIFQEKMYSLMEELEYVQCYLDDLLILSNKSFKDYIDKVDNMISRLNQVGLKIRAKKYNFAMIKLEYLGFVIFCERIKPMAKKVQAMLNIKLLKTVKQLQSFLGLINYYHDMWK